MASLCPKLALGYTGRDPACQSLGVAGKYVDIRMSLYQVDRMSDLTAEPTASTAGLDALFGPQAARPDGSEILAALRQAASQRILILDGAMLSLIHI